MRLYVVAALIAVCVLALITRSQGRYYYRRHRDGNKYSQYYPSGYRRSDRSNNYYDGRRYYQRYYDRYQRYQPARNQYPSRYGYPSPYRQYPDSPSYYRRYYRRSPSVSPSPSPRPSPSSPQRSYDNVIMHYHNLGKPQYYDYSGKKWNDADWESRQLWRYILHKWRSEVISKKNDENEISWWHTCTDDYYKNDCDGYNWNFDGTGSQNRYCFVCNSERSEEACINNGQWTECANGQDACIVDINTEGGYKRYNRRCGASCECGFRDEDFLLQDEKSCMPATCGKGFDCLTYQCLNNMFGDAKVPNVAYFINNTCDQLQKCRCDDWCYEPQYETNKDPTYRYPCCQSNCDQPCLDNYLQVLTPTLSFNNMDDSFCNPPTTTTSTTTTTTTTTMMPMMGGGGGD